MPVSRVEPIDPEAPPFLGTWSRVYAAVLVYLTLLIMALYFATRLLAY